MTSLGDYTFYNCSGLTSITIPSSVTNLGQYAFSGCSGLTSITLPNSMTCIGQYAFYGCTGSISITIPNSVTSIGNYAFYGCSGLKSVTIPNSVTSIGNYAFYDCTGLTAVTIPNSVTSIGNFAFYGCYLRSLTIGAGVTSIGSSAFSSITKTIWLTNTPPSGYKNAAGTINYVANNQYSSLSNKKEYPFLSSIFEVDGIKYVPVSPSERTCDALDCLYNESAQKVHINTTVSYKGVNLAVKYMNPYTCYNNYFIKDVELKFEGDMGNNAFYNCYSILHVNVANKGHVGEQAFYNCGSIKTVIVSNKGNIGTSAFENCDAITTVTVSNEGNIEKNAFNDCDSITNIDLSNNGYIGEQAFYSCNTLKTAKVCNIGSINKNAFAECVSLETCTLGEKVSRINDYSFQNCSKLQKIVIPDSVDLIGSYAFSGCTNLQSASIGNGTKTIGTYAFSNCSSLNKIKLGNHVEQINTYALYYCKSLPEIEIPASVTSIQNYTFYGCSSLATVLIADRESELKLGSNGSDPLFSSCPLDSVYIGGNITYSTSSSYGYSPFYRNTSLRTIHITDKETEISPNEFYGCTGLKNVRIGDGVTTIGNWAFSGCSSLDYFAFGSKLETIGKEAFSDCVNVTKIISRASTPPACGSQALDDISKWTCELTVPQSSIETYQSADQWKEFFFINGATYDDDKKAGDANGDGYVDVSDIALIVNYILGRDPNPFYFMAADVNNDGVIDIADFAGVANIIVHGGQDRMMAARKNVTEESDIRMEIPDVETQAGEWAMIPVFLVNFADAVSSFQMDIRLPQGVTIQDVSMVDERRANHSVDWCVMGDGMVRVLCFSPNNSRIKGINGPVIMLTAEVDASMPAGNYDISAGHIVLTAEGNRTTAEDITSTLYVGEATGITDIIEDEGREYYGVDGSRLNAPRKGINIIRNRNGKTIKISRTK